MVRWLKRIALLVVALVVLALVAAWMLLRGSLPKLDGEAALPGLSTAVTVQRDRLGVVTIDAASEADAMRALGYVHAQERYFGMDLMRRTAAGELSALFGPVALDFDKRQRAHRMRARATADLRGIAGQRTTALRAYTEGVNAGLAGLHARPWPYLLLRQAPEPWRMEDSALAGYAMYFDLQDADGSRELALWRLQQHLPPALYALLSHGGTSWDAPLQGDAIGDAVLPGPDEVDLRALPAPARNQAKASRTAAFTPPSAPRMVPLSPAVREKGAGGPPAAADSFPGSNNFAVSGALTSDGRAIVANDMHLGLRAPGTWFRARLRYPDLRAPGGKVDVQGFTLPGLPAVVVGSNGHVAWAFTNSYVDSTDWKRVVPCTPAGPATATCTPTITHRETIEVAGTDAVTLAVEDTAWGPILEHASDGSALALRWTAHLPGALNLGLSDFARAGDLAAVLHAADGAAIPTQNLLVADSAGHIAWRLLGPLPQRRGSCSTQRLVEAADAAGPTEAGAQPPTTADCRPWTISTAAAPLIADPPDHRLWTANARVVGDGDLRRLGDGGYDLGARAAQIRDDLFARQRFSERDLLAIQLDDRALFLQRWWQLLRDEATRAKSPALAGLADAAAQWSGHANTDSAGYRIVRAWRLAVIARIGDGLAAPAQAALGDGFEMPKLSQFEGVAWPLLQQRPAHLLSRRFATWDALLEDAAREVRDGLSARGPLTQRTWGERNTAHICHPLAGAIPLLGERLLCMPPDQLAGDGNMPRVAAPDFGASERMVVSPGHEADGIAHMPGGQSGHVLSPFWGAGHDDWVQGRPTPFLPGETEHTLTLTP